MRNTYLKFFAITNTVNGGDNSQNRSPWGSTGEATDQDTFAPDLLPHPPQTSWAMLA